RIAAWSFVSYWSPSVTTTLTVTSFWRSNSAMASVYAARSSSPPRNMKVRVLGSEVARLPHPVVARPAAAAVPARKLRRCMRFRPTGRWSARDRCAWVGEGDRPRHYSVEKRERKGWLAAASRSGASPRRRRPRISERRRSCHGRSEEHTSELQSRFDLVCRLLLEKK